MKSGTAASTGSREWFAIRNESANSAEVYIYDAIYRDGDHSAKVIIDQLRALTVETINLRINSPGGNVFDGFAIYNALASHKARVVAYIDGVAASIASVIAMAGESIRIAENAMMMIHNPLLLVMGDADELRKQAGLLDQLKESIVNTYCARSGSPRPQLARMMSEETWFTAQEAVEIGLADDIVEGVKAAACHDFSGLGFRNAPSRKVPITRIPSNARRNRITMYAEKPKRPRSTLRSLGIR